jgi:hypothetical protein
VVSRVCWIVCGKIHEPAELADASSVLEDVQPHVPDGTVEVGIGCRDTGTLDECPDRRLSRISIDQQVEQPPCVGFRRREGPSV